MTKHRIAISLGSGYVPGLAGVVRACAQAVEGRGWEAVGIRDGFDGIIFPERYPEGGIVPIDKDGCDSDGSLLGTGARTDPFRVQRQNPDGIIEEVDESGKVLATLRERGIDGVIAIVGGSSLTGSHALSVMWKLARKGLACVCIPKSAENDLAAIEHPYGYDSILSFTTACLRHARVAARDQGRVAVVEVPGQYAGWLALEAGVAANADVILLTEIPYRADLIATHLQTHPEAGLIVVAKDARARELQSVPGADSNHLRTPSGSCSLRGSGMWSPTVESSGDAAKQTYETIQRCTTRELFPQPLDLWVRAGGISEADRVLGGAYASEAVRFLSEGHSQHLIAAGQNGFEAIPLSLAVSRMRTIDRQSPALLHARSLGICLGDTE